VQTGDILVAGSICADITLSTTISDNTGGAITWTLQEDVNAASNCRTRMWTAAADSNRSLTVTFTRSADLGFDNFFGGNVLTFRGSDGPGAAEPANGTGGPSRAITTTQDNSALVVFSGDWNAVDGTSRTWRTVNSITPASGSGEVTYARDAAQYAVYGAYYSDAGAAGSKTVGLSAPVGQKYAIAVVEVKGTAGGGGSAFPHHYYQQMRQ
jgi:hypothetical protein